MISLGGEGMLSLLGLPRHVIERQKKNTKSPGPDEGLPTGLKECKEFISRPLANMFRKTVYPGFEAGLCS